MKKKKSPLAIRNDECKNFLSPIIKKMYPQCIICSGLTTTAHHFVHDSKSVRLRFELENMIPLCTSCHFMLHQNESYWAGKIIEAWGLDWFKRLDAMSQEEVKMNMAYLDGQFMRLKNIYESYQR